jgi:heme A synthase
MVVSASDVGRAALAAMLLGTVFYGALAKPPHRGVSKRILPLLMLGAAVAYALGVLAVVLGWDMYVAAFACIVGITAFAVVMWLARATDPGDPPWDEPPGPGPVDPDEPVDWDAFERQFQVYLERVRPLV